jgi:hypothetical protein
MERGDVCDGLSQRRVLSRVCGEGTLPGEEELRSQTIVEATLCDVGGQMWFPVDTERLAILISAMFGRVAVLHEQQHVSVGDFT